MELQNWSNERNCVFFPGFTSSHFFEPSPFIISSKLLQPQQSLWHVLDINACSVGTTSRYTSSRKAAITITEDLGRISTATRPLWQWTWSNSIANPNELKQRHFPGSTGKEVFLILRMFQRNEVELDAFMKNPYRKCENGKSASNVC